MATGRSALIVATSRYSDTRLATLDGPARDAEALKSVLGAADIGGFDVRTVINGRAARIRETLEAFVADRSRDDVLLIHFSGHGLKDDDGQLYLAATDTKLDRLMSTGIDAGWVNRLMERCRSERIGLFLDCCFAGAFSSAMTRRVAGDTAGVKDHFRGRGLVVITASDAMQYSFEGGRQVGEPPAPSPFSQALVDGLRTGEADRNEDGQVSINELFDFLEDRVQETSPAQTPTKSAVNQTGDWVIARSTRVPSIRLLPERVQLLLKSEQPIDRLEAVIELGRLLSSRDARTAQAATAALRGLTTDDSRRVAQRAVDVLGGEPSSPTAPAGVPVREAPTAAPEPPISEPTPIKPVSGQVEPSASIVEPAPASVEETVVPDRAAVPARSTAGRFGADVARGAARGLIGSLIGVVMAVIIALVDSNSGLTASDFQALGTIVGTIVVWSTIVATVVEVVRLRLRLPRMTLWTKTAGNRWIEASIVGILVALVAVVFDAGGAFSGVKSVISDWVSALLMVTLTQVVGFLVAEAVVGSIRPHAEPGSDA